MAEASVNTDPLSLLAAKMEGLSGKDFPRVDRAGLRAVNEVVKPELVAVTPEAAVQPTQGSTALSKGALRASVRARVLAPKGERGGAAVIDFGSNNYVANFVDGGTSHSTGTGFIRSLQDRIADQATEAYVTAATAEVEAILNE